MVGADIPSQLVNPDQLKVFSAVEERHWWFVARRHIFGQIVRHLVPPDCGATIVDIGCGTGGNIGSFQGAYRCIGVDTSQTAIALAKREHPKVEFVYAPDVSEVQPLVSRASFVLITDVIEHVADDFLFFSTIAGWVQPGAYLLLTVPADMSLWSQHDESNLHFRRYDRDRFRAVWDGLPVKTKLLSSFNSRLYPVVKFVRWMNRLRGRSLGSAGMDLVVPSPLINRLLTNILAGESGRLSKQLRGANSGYGNGVSLIAVLQRQAGELLPRNKPLSLPADPYVPGKAA